MSQIAIAQASELALPSLQVILAWASELLPQTPVGRTCSSSHCPICQALSIICGGIWDVESKCIRNFTTREQYAVPVAYEILIKEIDALDEGVMPGIPRQQELTAATLVQLICKVLQTLSEGVESR